MAAKDEAKEPLVRCRVARGRSIMVPTGQTRTVGTKENGDPITTAVIRLVDQLEWIDLPASEAQRLRASGYVCAEGTEHLYDAPRQPNVVRAMPSTDQPPGMYAP